MKTSRNARRKLTRKEVAAKTHGALIEAGLKSVAQYGYGGSSVSRITEIAGVSQGTLYTYFGSHQALLEMLLPLEGERLLTALGKEGHSAENYFDLERRTFYGLNRYLDRRPYMLRLLSEAEIAAPESYARHMENVESRYLAAFKRAETRGEIRHFTPRELRVIAEVLAGCRGHISIHQRARYKARTDARREAVELGADAYVKFLRFGIGAKEIPSPKQSKPLTSIPGQQSRNTRSALFEAAGRIIDEVGFSATTVKDIAARAGVAIGTFYTHFDGRDEFFEELLLYARRQLTRHIKSRTEDCETFAELEIAGFQAFFEVLGIKPWLIRIAAEAAVWAPEAYRHHLRIIALGYFSKLIAAKKRGEFDRYEYRELIVLGPIFMAARHYLAARYMRGTTKMMPNWIVKTYAELICRGIGVALEQEGRAGTSR